MSCLTLLVSHAQPVAANPCGKLRTAAQAQLGVPAMLQALEKFALDARIAMETFEVSKPPTSLRDQPFGNFKMGEQDIAYEQLPPRVRGVGLTDVLYFGRPEPNREDALKTIKNFFQYGRSNRGSAHRDVAEHVFSTKKTPSGFLQTTKVYAVAEEFAIMLPTRKGQIVVSEYGIILLVDPSGAQLLDLEYWEETGLPGAAQGLVHSMNREKEVLFSTMLPPQRVIGAVLLKIDRSSGLNITVDAVYGNPNYVPQSP